MAKIAIILMNLGGPDKMESIYPFLMNFFLDKNIIRLPQPFRYFIAKMIAHRRTKKEAGDAYGKLGGKSPLLDNTMAQANELKKILGDDYSVHVHMRYWHPMADEVSREISEEKPKHVIIMPLYPQYSTTTTRSSLQELKKSFTKFGVKSLVSTICCYPFNQGFINASAELIRQNYPKDSSNTRLLFSAHGLPVDIIKDGDPYEWQCKQSASLIAKATGIKNIDWQICYQSRVGHKKWLSPSVEEALKQAANDDKDVLIYPHSFVSEHVETLIELDIEYKHVADQLGIKNYKRVPTVSVNKLFINALADMITSQENRVCEVKSDTGNRICPHHFRRCGMDNDNCFQLRKAS